MPSPVPRRWLRRGLIAAAVVVVAVGVAAAIVLLHKPGNVSHPNLQFTRPSTTPAPAKRTQHNADDFSWPWYGFTASRTRYFAAPADLRPPLRVGWRFNDGALLEFPPVINRESLYLLDDSGSAAAVNLRNGRVQWRHQVGTLAAASPAVAAQAGEVLMPVLSTHGRSPGAGRFVALSMKTGRVIWSRPLGAGSESSAIVSGQTVYYGDQAGNLYARNISNGHLYWTYKASGAIKGGPALVGGVLYFGDYSGRAYAVRAVNGHQVWAVGTDGAHFGFGSGQFYSTPAVAYGRVYMGNTDGRVYSFGARTGALAWATSTGAYVYASPAVASPKGLGPTVYVGSYDGSLYAFNAQSGAVRWRHPGGGRISGSATVLDNVVYYSDLGTKTTAGLNAVTGRQVFSFPDGAFTPIIADYQAIYLVGYSHVYQLLPARQHAAKPAARKHRASHPAHTPAKRRPAKPRLARRHHQAARRRPRQRSSTTPGATAGRASKRPAPSAVHPAAIVHGLCVVVVEATVSRRPRRAVGSARSTRQSSIACAKSSRMPLPPASVGAGPSGRLPAAVPAATSLASRPPRTATRALRPATWKRPRNRGLLAVGSQHKLNTSSEAPVVPWRRVPKLGAVTRSCGRPRHRARVDP